MKFIFLKETPTNITFHSNNQQDRPQYCTWICLRSTSWGSECQLLIRHIGVQTWRHNVDFSLHVCIRVSHIIWGLFRFREIVSWTKFYTDTRQDLSKMGKKWKNLQNKQACHTCTVYLAIFLTQKWLINKMDNKPPFESFSYSSPQIFLRLSPQIFHRVLLHIFYFFFLQPCECILLFLL